MFVIFCLFSKLEYHKVLDPDDEIDLLSLHFAYHHLIKKAIKDFQLMWDRHRLRTENLSPNQLFAVGLEDLNRRATSDPSLNFTELIQPNMHDLDTLYTVIMDQYKDDSHEEGSYQNFNVPNCVLERLPKIRQCFPISTIDLRNAEFIYRRVRRIFHRIIKRKI